MTTGEPGPDAPSEVARDEQVLGLRDGGDTYVAIARELGFEQAGMARASYLRALRRRTPDDRSRLRDREFGRLEVLAAHIERRTDLSEEDHDRQSRAIELMRRDLLDP